MNVWHANFWELLRNVCLLIYAAVIASSPGHSPAREASNSNNSCLTNLVNNLAVSLNILFTYLIITCNYCHCHFGTFICHTSQPYGIVYYNSLNTLNMLCTCAWLLVCMLVIYCLISYNYGCVFLGTGPFPTVTTINLRFWRNYNHCMAYSL